LIVIVCVFASTVEVLQVESVQMYPATRYVPFLVSDCESGIELEMVVFVAASNMLPSVTVN
jgi:hypothetical protein